VRAVDPAISNGVVVNRLARAADPAGTQNQTGNGRLQIARALADRSIDSVQPAGAPPAGLGGPFVGPYKATPVGLTSISPSSGPINGGTQVTIIGAGFTEAQAPFTVSFGDIEVRAIRIDNTRVTVTTPPHPPETVDVSVKDKQSKIAAFRNGFTYEKAVPRLGITNSGPTYDGLSHRAAINGSIQGTVSDVRYNGSSTLPVNAGTYMITANFVPTDTVRYNTLTDVAVGEFVIQKATPTLAVSNTSAVYNGSPQPALVGSSVAGTVNDIKNNGSTSPPINAAVYAITADFSPLDAINYSSLVGASAGNFIIQKATPKLYIIDGSQTYTGSPHAVSVTSGAVTGMISDVKYNGSQIVPTNAGTYAITADFAPSDNANYNSLADAFVGDFIIQKATPALYITNSSVTYNALAQSATVRASLPGTITNKKYDGLASVPTNAGSYEVTVDFVPADSTNYNSLTDISAGTFTIQKATPTLSVTNSPTTYNRAPQSVTVSGATVAGSVNNVLYNGVSAVPTNAGTYSIKVDFTPSDTTNYNVLTGALAGNFTIEKATAILRVMNSPVTYNGSAQTAIVSGGATRGVISNLKYDGTSTPPTNAGSYVITADFKPDDSANYKTSASAPAGDLVIRKATPALAVTNTPVMYDGSAHAVTITASVKGTVSNTEYNGSTTTPIDAGTYSITANFVPDDTANYNSFTDAPVGEFVIQPATETHAPSEKH
jgi:hypothetical protein